MLKPTKKKNLETFTFQVANNKGADQTVRMRRLVCAFVVSKQQIQGFSRRGPYAFLASAWLRLIPSIDERRHVISNNVAF